MSSIVSCLEEIRAKSEVDEETPIQYPHPSEKTELFQLFFLAEDGDQSVEVVETPKIDFGMVVRRLKDGESVFITRKSVQEPNLS